MKKYLFLLIPLITTHLFAADVIILKNSVRIDANILDVSSSEIKYQLVDTLPELILTQKLNNVSSVVFDNGEIYTGTALINETSFTPKCALFGVTIGGGGCFRLDSYGTNNYETIYKDNNISYILSSRGKSLYSASIGIDAAWKINYLNALGFYIKTGSAFERRVTILDNNNHEYYIDHYNLGFRITVGLLGSVGDISNFSSFLYGMGVGFQCFRPLHAYYADHLRDSWAVPFEIRLGGAFKNGFYFTTDLAFDYGPVGGLQLSIHLGYNFQHK